MSFVLTPWDVVFSLQCHLILVSHNHMEYRVQSTEYRVQSTEYSSWYPALSKLYKTYIVYHACTLYIVHSTQYTQYSTHNKCQDGPTLHSLCVLCNLTVQCQRSFEFCYNILRRREMYLNIKNTTNIIWSEWQWWI